MIDLKQLTSSRDRIATLHMIIDRQYHSVKQGQLKKSSYEVWVVKEKSRCDVTAPRDESEILEREVFCFNCDKAGYMTKTKIAPDRSTPVSYTVLSEIKGKAAAVRIDWIHLGYWNDSLEGKHEDYKQEIETVTKRATSSSFEKAASGRVYTLRHNSQDPKRSSILCQFDADQDFNPLLLQAALRDNSSEIVQQTTISYQVHFHSKIAFPSVIFHTRQRNGKLYLSEQLTIRDLSIIEAVCVLHELLPHDKLAMRIMRFMPWQDIHVAP